MKKASMMTGTRQSPLQKTQWLGSNGAEATKKHSDLALALPLTSLIDAFSIIVIYLLIGTQSGLLEGTGTTSIQLPMAEAGQSIEKQPPAIVRIEKGEYFLNEKRIASSQLGAKLADLKKSAATGEDVEILIQADQKMDYADLDPLLRAGSEAGIQKLKFAVMPSK